MKTSTSSGIDWGAAALTAFLSTYLFTFLGMACYAAFHSHDHWAVITAVLMIGVPVVVSVVGVVVFAIYDGLKGLRHA